MFTPFKMLGAVALIALATGVAAQEAPTPEAAEATETAQAAGPQIGEAYIRDQHGDWSMRCVKAEEGQPDPCQLYQLLDDAEGNSVAEISLFPLPPGGEAVAGANIVAPLETLLTAGIGIEVDGANGRRYPFTFCNRGGCVARVGFTADEVNQFKRGKKAVVTLAHAGNPETPVQLDLSLSGFTAGYDSAKPLEE